MWAGARSGTISVEERSIIERAFRLDDRTVGAVMAPRESVEWLDSTSSIDMLRLRATSSALSIVERFRETRSHLAVVVNESGAVRGLVTPTDILEALVGELPEAGDASEPMIIEWGEDGKSWSVDARTDLDEVKLLAHVRFLDGQKEGYQTVGGFVVDNLGPTPQSGDSFLASGVEFKVLDTDGRRIDRVLLTAVDVAESPREDAIRREDA